MSSLAEQAPPRWLALGWIPLTVILIGGTADSNPDADKPWALSLALISAIASAAALFVPASAVLVVGAVVGLYQVLDLADGPILGMLPLTALAACLRGEPRRLAAWLVLAGGLVCAGCAFAFVVHDDPGPEKLWQSVGTAALTAAAATVSWWVRGRTEVRRAHSARAASEERLRMAQDLHDGVGHGLAVIAMQSGVALHVLEKDPASVRASLEAIRETSLEALAALRAEVSQLAGGAPPRRPDRDLSDLAALADRVRRAGVDVEVEEAGGTLTGDPVASATAYAVVQESLTNVLRHADAKRVRVRVTGRAGRLAVLVHDDGTGYRGGPVSEGMGLAGIRRRVEELGGSVTVRGAADGFRVEASIPERAR